MLQYTVSSLTVTGPHGRIWASKPIASQHGLVAVFQAPASKVSESVRGPDFTVVAMDGRADMLVTTDACGKVYVFDIRNNRYSCLDKAGSSGTAAVMNGPRSVFVAFADSTIRCYDASKGIVVGVLKEHRSPVRHLEVNRELNELMSTSFDGVLIWDLKKLRRKRVLGSGPYGALQASYTADGQAVVTQFKDGSFYIWTAGTFSLVRSFTLPVAPPLRPTQSAFGLSPDGQLLVSCGPSLPVLLLYSVISGELRYGVALPAPPTPLDVGVAAITDGGGSAAAADAAAASEATAGGVPLPAAGQHGMAAVIAASLPMGVGCTQVRFLPDSSTVAALLTDGSVAFVDVVGCQFVGSVPYQFPHRRDCRFTMDGMAQHLTLIANGKVMLHDLASSRTAVQPPQPLRRVLVDQLDDLAAAVALEHLRQQQREMAHESAAPGPDTQALPDNYPHHHPLPQQAIGADRRALSAPSAGTSPSRMYPSASGTAAQQRERSAGRRVGWQLATTDPGVGAGAGRSAAPGRGKPHEANAVGGAAGAVASGGSAGRGGRVVTTGAGGGGAKGGAGGRVTHLDAAAVSLNRSRLEALLEAFGEYPAKYRLMIWEFLLRLPNNTAAFSSLAGMGLHPAFKELQDRLPLANRALAQRLMATLSQLAHWCPVFAESSFLPDMIFPFVKLFAASPRAGGGPRSSAAQGSRCFEALATLLSCGWMRGWWERFPHPPLGLLNRLQDLIALHDAALAAHFSAYRGGLAGVVWPQLANLWTELLARSDWLRLWDHCITAGPDLLYYFIAAYFISLRGQLLAIDTDHQLANWMAGPPGVDMGELLRTTYQLRSRTPEELRPVCSEWQPLPQGPTYVEFKGFPAGAVELFASERTRIRDAEEAIMRRRAVVSELELRTRAVTLQAASLSSERQKLAALEEERRAMLRELEAQTATEMARLDDRAKEEKLKQIAAVEKAYQANLLEVRITWQRELEYARAELAHKRALAAQQIRSREEDEQIKALEFHAQQRMRGMEDDVRRAAVAAAVRDELAVHQMEADAKQRAKMKEWETEDEARKLRLQAETSRRSELALAAEEGAARSAAVREARAVSLQLEDEVLKMDGKRRLRLLAEDTAIMTAEVRAAEEARIAARVTAEQEAMLLRARADNAWYEAEKMRREQLLVAERQQMEAAAEAARRKLAETEAAARTMAAEANLLDRRRLLERQNAAEEAEVRRLVGAMAAERGRDAVLVTQLEGKEEEMRAKLDAAARSNSLQRAVESTEAAAAVALVAQLDAQQRRELAELRKVQQEALDRLGTQLEGQAADAAARRRAELKDEQLAALRAQDAAFEVRKAELVRELMAQQQGLKGKPPAAAAPQVPRARSPPPRPPPAAHPQHPHPHSQSTRSLSQPTSSAFLSSSPESSSFSQILAAAARRDPHPAHNLPHASVPPPRSRGIPLAAPTPLSSSTSTPQAHLLGTLSAPDSATPTRTFDFLSDSNLTPTSYLTSPTSSTLTSAGPIQRISAAAAAVAEAISRRVSAAAGPPPPPAVRSSAPVAAMAAPPPAAATAATPRVTSEGPSQPLAQASRPVSEPSEPLRAGLNAPSVLESDRASRGPGHLSSDAAADERGAAAASASDSRPRIGPGSTTHTAVAPAAAPMARATWEGAAAAVSGASDSTPGSIAGGGSGGIGGSGGGGGGMDGLFDRIGGRPFLWSPDSRALEALLADMSPSLGDSLGAATSSSLLGTNRESLDRSTGAALAAATALQRAAMAVAAAVSPARMQWGQHGGLRSSSPTLSPSSAPPSSTTTPGFPRHSSAPGFEMKPGALAMPPLPPPAHQQLPSRPQSAGAASAPAPQHQPTRPHQQMPQHPPQLQPQPRTHSDDLNMAGMGGDSPLSDSVLSRMSFSVDTTTGPSRNMTSSAARTMPAGAAATGGAPPGHPPGHQLQAPFHMGPGPRSLSDWSPPPVSSGTSNTAPGTMFGAGSVSGGDSGIGAGSAAGGGGGAVLGTYRIGGAGTVRPFEPSTSAYTSESYTESYSRSSLQHAGLLPLSRPTASQPQQQPPSPGVSDSQSVSQLTPPPLAFHYSHPALQHHRTQLPTDTISTTSFTPLTNSTLQSYTAFTPALRQPPKHMPPPPPPALPARSSPLASTHPAAAMASDLTSSVPSSMSSISITLSSAASTAAPRQRSQPPPGPPQGPFPSVTINTTAAPMGRNNTDMVAFLSNRHPNDRLPNDSPPRHLSAPMTATSEPSMRTATDSSNASSQPNVASPVSMATAVSQTFPAATAAAAAAVVAAHRSPKRSPPAAPSAAVRQLVSASTSFTTNQTSIGPQSQSGSDQSVPGRAVHPNVTDRSGPSRGSGGGEGSGEGDVRSSLEGGRGRSSGDSGERYVDVDGDGGGGGNSVSGMSSDMSNVHSFPGVDRLGGSSRFSAGVYSISRGGGGGANSGARYGETSSSGDVYSTSYTTTTDSGFGMAYYGTAAGAGASAGGGATGSGGGAVGTAGGYSSSYTTMTIRSDMAGTAAGGPIRATASQDIPANRGERYDTSGLSGAHSGSGSSAGLLQSGSRRGTEEGTAGGGGGGEGGGGASSAVARGGTGTGQTSSYTTTTTTSTQSSFLAPPTATRTTATAHTRDTGLQTVDSRERPSQSGAGRRVLPYSEDPDHESEGQRSPSTLASTRTGADLESSRADGGGGGGAGGDSRGALGASASLLASAAAAGGDESPPLDLERLLRLLHRSGEEAEASEEETHTMEGLSESPASQPLPSPSHDRGHQRKRSPQHLDKWQQQRFDWEYSPYEQQSEYPSWSDREVSRKLQEIYSSPPRVDLPKPGEDGNVDAMQAPAVTAGDRPPTGLPRRSSSGAPPVPLPAGATAQTEGHGFGSRLVSSTGSGSDRGAPLRAGGISTGVGRGSSDGGRYPGLQESLPAQDVFRRSVTLAAAAVAETGTRQAAAMSDAPERHLQSSSEEQEHHHHRAVMAAATATAADARVPKLLRAGSDPVPRIPQGGPGVGSGPYLSVERGAASAGETDAGGWHVAVSSAPVSRGREESLPQSARSGGSSAPPTGRSGASSGPQTARSGGSFGPSTGRSGGSSAPPTGRSEGGSGPRTFRSGGSSAPHTGGGGGSYAPRAGRSGFSSVPLTGGGEQRREGSMSYSGGEMSSDWLGTNTPRSFAPFLGSVTTPAPATDITAALRAVGLRWDMAGLTTLGPGDSGTASLTPTTTGTSIVGEEELRALLLNSARTERTETQTDDGQ